MTVVVTLSPSCFDFVEHACCYCLILNIYTSSLSSGYMATHDTVTVTDVQIDRRLALWTERPLDTLGHQQDKDII